MPWRPFFDAPVTSLNNKGRNLQCCGRNQWLTCKPVILKQTRNTNMSSFKVERQKTARLKSSPARSDWYFVVSLLLLLFFFCSFVCLFYREHERQRLLTLNCWILIHWIFFKWQFIYCYQTILSCLNKVGDILKLFRKNCCQNQIHVKPESGFISAELPSPLLTWDEEHALFVDA